MGDLIFQGFLNSSEYYRLWFSKRRKLFLLYLFILSVHICFSILFGLSFASDNEVILAMRIPSIVICGIASVSLGISWYFTFTTGGIFPRGDVKVYKENRKLYLIWNYKNRDYSKTVTINKVMVKSDHLFVEESRKNFVFLPKELENIISIN